MDQLSLLGGELFSARITGLQLGGWREKNLALLFGSYKVGGICQMILWVEGEGGSLLPLLLTAYFKPGQAEPNCIGAILTFKQALMVSNVWTDSQ